MGPLFFGSLTAKISPFCLCIGIAAPRALHGMLTGPGGCTPDNICVVHVRNAFIGFLSLSPRVRRSVVAQLSLGSATVKYWSRFRVTDVINHVPPGQRRGRIPGRGGVETTGTILVFLYTSLTLPKKLPFHFAGFHHDKNSSDTTFIYDGIKRLPGTVEGN